MSRKFVYLVNPISGTRKKDSLYSLIAQRTSFHGFEYEILPTVKSGDYSALRTKILREGITDVIVCGGDGTMSAVTGSLLGCNVDFGIVPMGSGNGLALAARIPRKWALALELILTGTASPIDGFYVNGKFSCMLCGIGFDAKVAHEFAGASTRGLQTYIRISFRNFFTARTYQFEIESGSLKFHTDAFFISIANSNQFGNNFTIAPQASLKDGLLDVVVVKKMNKLLLPFFIAKQVTGFNMLEDLDDKVSKKNIAYFQTTRVNIINPDSAPIHIDGDPVACADAIEIKIAPNAFRLLHNAS